MKQDQKALLQKKISEKIETTKADIEKYQLLTKPVSPDNAIGRLTRMEAINSKSINEAALKKAEHTLAQLEKALGKRDDPDFGECIDCGGLIPLERLMILPESDRCVPCAEKMGR